MKSDSLGCATANGWLLEGNLAQWGSPRAHVSASRVELYIDSSNGKAPNEVIIDWAFNTLPGDGFTAICVIGNRGL
jgi:hypothetical protein